MPPAAVLLPTTVVAELLLLRHVRFDDPSTMTVLCCSQKPLTLARACNSRTAIDAWVMSTARNVPRTVISPPRPLHSNLRPRPNRTVLPGELHRGLIKGGSSGGSRARATLLLGPVLSAGWLIEAPVALALPPARAQRGDTDDQNQRPGAVVRGEKLARCAKR